MSKLSMHNCFLAFEETLQQYPETYDFLTRKPSFVAGFTKLDVTFMIYGLAGLARLGWLGWAGLGWAAELG